MPWHTWLKGLGIFVSQGCSFALHNQIQQGKAFSRHALPVHTETNEEEAIMNCFGVLHDHYIRAFCCTPDRSIT